MSLKFLGQRALRDWRLRYLLAAECHDWYLEHVAPVKRLVVFDVDQREREAKPRLQRFNDRLRGVAKVAARPPVKGDYGPGLGHSLAGSGGSSGAGP